jgi:hypothetical protein
MGGGTKLTRALLADEGEGVCCGMGEGSVERSGEAEGRDDSSLVGEGVGVGGSCATAIRTNPIDMTQPSKVTTRNLSIVAPVHVWKNVVPPFAIAQKCFIDHIGDKLIVQTVETSKVIDCAFGCVFACGPCLD